MALQAPPPTPPPNWPGPFPPSQIPSSGKAAKVASTLNNASAIYAKFLVAALGVVLTGYISNDWTGVPSVISDAVAVLVYLIPNKS